MTIAVHCPSCGAPLAANSPEGLCPRCLMQQAMAGSQGTAPPRQSAEVTFALEPASSSVLIRIAETIGRVPHVLLRDTEIENGPGPILKPASPEMPEPTGRPDRYQLFGEIARGGMGAVLRGRDVDLGRDLAVKVLLDSHKDQPDLIKRFVEEAQIGGQLQHPGIVPVYELGSFADRRPFFTMKLVKGRTLADLLRMRSSRAEDLPRFLSIFESIAQTMAYAHSRGVIHRDLKPSNIMVGSFGEVQVMDWGLAKVLPQGGAAHDEPEVKAEAEIPVSMIRTARSGSDVDASQAGSVLGTPAYMAPEQARGELDRVDERADVFGLGAILGEMLTGEPAFTARSANGIMLRATMGELDETFTRLDACAAESELIALAKHCLAPERDDRPAHAGIVAERITAYLTGVQERLRKAELARVEERARRRLTMAIAASVLAILFVGGGGWGYLQRLKFERRAAVERAVTAALDEANLLRGQASSAPIGELGRWDEAISAVRRAEGLLAGGEADEAVRGRVLALLSGLKQERAKAQAKADELRRDREFLARLESIYGGMSINLKFDRADADLAAAFRDFGVDVDRLDPTEAGRRLRDRSAAAELAWYLDAWALMRDIGALGMAPGADKPADQRASALARSLAGKIDPECQRLVDVARAVDPDPWRGAVRATIGKRDPATIAALRKLADDAKGLETQPWPSLTLLGMQLYYSTHDVERAESVLRRAWRLKPDEFFVNLMLAVVVSEGTGPQRDMAARRAEVVRFWTAAVAIRPASAIGRANLANALLAQGKPADAADEYRAAVRLQPEIDWTHDEFANVLRSQGKLDEAIKEYREAVRLKPDNGSYHFNLAGALREQGKSAVAIAEYRTALRLKPDDVGIHGNFGIALREQGKLDEAIAELQTAIRLKPDIDWIHAGLGDALTLQRKRDEGIAEYREAIRLKPDDASHHNSLGNALRDQGKLAEAIAEFRQAIRLQPDNPWPHFNLGLAFHRQGKLADAIKEIRQAIRLKPDDAAIHQTLGNLLRAQGKLDGATVELQSAIRLQPEIEWFHVHLGEVLTLQGKRDEAIAEYRKAIVLKPDHAQIRAAAAWVLVIAPDRPASEYDEAAEHARKALALEPKGENAQLVLALAEYRRGRWSEAIAAAERSMALRQGGNAFEWFVLAMAHARQGDKAKAGEWFDKAVAQTKENASDNADLRSIWTEAAKVLGRLGPEAKGR